MNSIKLELVKLIAKAANVSEEHVLASLEMPKDEFGDITSKISFILAGQLKKNPAEIANELSKKIQKNEWFEKIETKGPYINFYFSNKFYVEAIKKILKEKDKFGKGKKTGKKIMIEFFHANTHKGVHIGHIRNISIGESLSRILEYTGNDVIRANFQGDIGPHVAKCLWGFINLYKEKDPQLNRGIWLGKVYSETSKRIEENKELEKQVQDINLKIYEGDKHLTDIWKKTRQWCIDDFEKFYKEFSVKFDEFYFESQTEKIGKTIVMELLKKEIVKQDQEAIIMDLKQENLGVFVLITKEGYALYSTKDLGLAKLKFEKYDLDKSIHVVGKEQEHHFKQLFKTFEKIGSYKDYKMFQKAAKVSYHLIYELVILPQGKMSSREGTMVLYEDLKQKLLDITREEVKKRHIDWKENDIEKTALMIALAALKFSMIHRENNRVLIFDWNEAIKLEGDTGPYLQYACVRSNGIINKANEEKIKAEISNEYEFNKEERNLIKKLVEIREICDKATKDLSPNVLANYLLELATYFNKFYNVSPVLTAERENEKKTRLALVQASNEILKTGLYLAGIDCPDKM